jgi:hypothetical protein
MPKEEWVERLVAEGDALQEKVAKLGAFVAGDNFANLTDVDQGLLNAQLGAMTAYLSVVTLRIARATGQA